MNKKVLIAITGASGSIYPAQMIDRLLTLRSQWDELSVVATDNAMEVWKVEMDRDFERKEGVRYFNKNDFSAPFASGSGQYDTMIVAPCSMGALGRIANGISNDLITRAADVVLKERRRLICVVRETPYNLIHIKNMEMVTLAGGIICPATPSFYSVPKTIEEAAQTVTDRVLDLAGFDIKSFRWGN
ncbi:UbiX family flavin prenyltransferase [Niabella insulamsoli]|uniref:UbiX family flavin prenyltransferase n=1 Tax=Niabella insulamsoli TaxID=3144874 RepID=UPI0031FC208A